MDKVINHQIIESVYQATQDYLAANEGLETFVTEHISALFDAMDLKPETYQTLSSGHLFPFAEAHWEAEQSWELCMRGFYRHSFVALRSSLELSVVGLFFDRNDRGHLTMGNWISSVKPTPKFHEALNHLFENENFLRYDEKYQLKEEIKQIYYDRLSDYVHTRGYRYSVTRRTRTNVICFCQELLTEYVDVLQRTVKCILVMMLLKYPIGMQQLPIWSKFGLNGPAGGVLEEASWASIMSIIPEQGKVLLREISDSDDRVKSVVAWVNGLPDLTESQIKAQMQEWDTMVAKINATPEN